jgi:hypothetical protein
MKKSSITQSIIRATVIGLLALTPPTAFVVLRAADKPAAAAAPSQLSNELIGTWVLVGAPGKVQEPPATGGRLKFLTGKYWTVTQADPKTGMTLFHHGGTYELEGNSYIEKIEYANRNTTNLIGKSFKFTATVEGDTLTLVGDGNSMKEVWKRAK